VCDQQFKSERNLASNSFDKVENGGPSYAARSCSLSLAGGFDRLNVADVQVRQVAEDNGVDVSEQIKELETRAIQLRQDTYSRLTPVQRLQVRPRQGPCYRPGYYVTHCFTRDTRCDQGPAQRAAYHTRSTSGRSRQCVTTCGLCAVHHSTAYQPILLRRQLSSTTVPVFYQLYLNQDWYA
jgi:hypothetical protein